MRRTSCSAARPRPAPRYACSTGRKWSAPRRRDASGAWSLPPNNLANGDAQLHHHGDRRRRQHQRRVGRVEGDGGCAAGDHLKRRRRYRNGQGFRDGEARDQGRGDRRAARRAQLLDRGRRRCHQVHHRRHDRRARLHRRARLREPDRRRTQQCLRCGGPGDGQRRQLRNAGDRGQRRQSVSRAGGWRWRPQQLPLHHREGGVLRLRRHRHGELRGGQGRGHGEPRQFRCQQG